MRIVVPLRYYGRISFMHEPNTEGTVKSDSPFGKRSLYCLVQREKM